MIVKQNENSITIEPGGDIGSLFELRMIEANKIDGLLPVSISENDGVVSMTYDIQNMMPLTEYLETVTVTSAFLVDFINRIEGIRSNLAKYLLLPSDIIIDPKQIYIHADTWDISFLYLPGCDSQGQMGYSPLLKSLLRHIDESDHDIILLAYRLYYDDACDSISFEKAKKYIYMSCTKQNAMSHERVDEYAEVPYDSWTDSTYVLAGDDEAESVTAHGQMRTAQMPIQNPVVVAQANTATRKPKTTSVGMVATEGQNHGMQYEQSGPRDMAYLPRDEDLDYLGQEQVVKKNILQIISEKIAHANAIIDEKIASIVEKIKPTMEPRYVEEEEWTGLFEEC